MDGGRNCLTLVGVSFSIECRLWGGCRLSGWGVDDMGKNFGGSKEMKWNEPNWNELSYKIKILDFEFLTENPLSLVTNTAFKDEMFISLEG